VVAEVGWVPELDLSLAFYVGPLAALMTVVVAGIGVCVFVYAIGYFAAGVTGMARFASTMLAFSASMLGLVWSDSIWALFVFWELTSITSFLLVGHKHADEGARTAARRALIVTVSGGLALLAAFVLIADASGTERLSEMGPIEGAGANVAAILLLFGAATKSAQVPFHVWLPGAMAAPTPVSAYLHSATMVKAGVILVALADPVLSDTDTWKPLAMAVGITSILWGALGALRHFDAKLILAYGTISQLGLMITLLSVGTAKAALAAVAIIAAHAVFKAALFMVVGEVDVRTGTRDIRELSGLRRSMPTAFAVALVSGASMAGAGPLLGFPAKEAAIEATLALDGLEAFAVALGVIGGSILTVAYTTRLLLGMFAGQGEPTAVAAKRSAMVVPGALLAAMSFLGYVGLASLSDRVLIPAAQAIDSGADLYSLLRWPGMTDALAVSIAVVASGLLLGGAMWRKVSREPLAVGAAAFDRILDGTLVAARLVTGRIQHGSLPVYLATMAATATLATLPLIGAVDVDALTWWDTPMQGVVAALVVAASLGAAALGSRLGAALGLGAVGLAVSALFLIHGAPDLALTQLLVETVVVVGFVLGLGSLRKRFPTVGPRWRAIRIGVGLSAGIAVALALAAAASEPGNPPPVAELAEASVEQGGGNNVVNVILTDIRALDTLGEILVLAVVAIGILALARLPRLEDDPDAAPAVVEGPAEGGLPA
jgi:multicomponent Na+:H+ antiporter subunit A